MRAALVLLLALGLVATAPVASASDLVPCVPEPAGTHPKELVSWVVFVLFYWDPAPLDCLGG